MMLEMVPFDDGGCDGSAAQYLMMAAKYGLTGGQRDADEQYGRSIRSGWLNERLLFAAAAACAALTTVAAAATLLLLLLRFVCAT